MCKAVEFIYVGNVNSMLHWFEQSITDDDKGINGCNQVVAKHMLAFKGAVWYYEAT